MTLQRRLAVAVAALLVTLVVAGGLVLLSQRRYVTRQLDAQVAALVETTQRYRQYVRADPAITGEIDDDQLVRWLEQFDRVPSDTLCSITRADLVHLLETARRYKKVADILNTLRTTL